MKCSYCGAEVRENQKYCLHCGAKQENTVTISEIDVKDEPRAAFETGPVEVQEWMDRIKEFREKLEPAEAPEVVSAATLEAVPAVPKAASVAEIEEEFPVIRPMSAAPRIQLPVQRGLGKMFFLGLLTAGIYPTVIWSRIVTELNIAASRYDGKRTVSYFGACMLTPVTLGIYAWVWMHNFCNRVGAELERRNIDYSFDASTFWLWGVLGSFILVGPFIFTHKLMKAMNQINEDFNLRG